MSEVSPSGDCPICQQGTLTAFPIHQFRHRRDLKAKRCTMCGFTALFVVAGERAVQVNGRVLREMVTFR